MVQKIICDQQKVMILTFLCFVERDNFHKFNQTFMNFEALIPLAEVKKLNVGYKRTTIQSHGFTVTTIKFPTIFI